MLLIQLLEKLPIITLLRQNLIQINSLLLLRTLIIEISHPKSRQIILNSLIHRLYFLLILLNEMRIPVQNLR